MVAGSRWLDVALSSFADINRPNGFLKLPRGSHCFPESLCAHGEDAVVSSRHGLRVGNVSAYAQRFVAPRFALAWTAVAAVATWIAPLQIAATIS